MASNTTNDSDTNCLSSPSSSPSPSPSSSETLDQTADHHSTLISYPQSSTINRHSKRFELIQRLQFRYVLPSFAILFVGYCALISVSINTIHRKNRSIVGTTEYEENENYTSSPQRVIRHVHGVVKNEKYLINTENCHLKDWPAFDQQTLRLFENVTDKTYDCEPDKFYKYFQITRVNYTKVQINITDTELDIGRWKCYACEIIRDASNDKMYYGPYIGPIKMITDFDRDLMQPKIPKLRRTPWVGVEIKCNRTGKNGTVDSYIQVVPLIQKPPAHKTARKTRKQIMDRLRKTNIILIGIDSVSRLNFIRHFLETRKLIDEHEFIELKGHHKVGENTFPNLFAMFTGHYAYEYWNWTMGTSYKFDEVPLIFKNYSKNGWITTYIEDMPPFGTFHHHKGGFLVPPADYYMRPVNLAIRTDLNYYMTCYKDRPEFEFYYDYVLDLFRYFRTHGRLPHMTLAHWSTMTHDWLNMAGHADKSHARFLRRLFAGKYHKNSLIILYSDHGMRFGSIMKTQAGIHEIRLPYLFIYVPYVMKLEGMNSKRLKRILRLNSNRLTSHMDLYSTMVHILTGNGTLANQHRYGRSLFTPIPLNRTCADAGITEQFCMCNSWVELLTNDYHQEMATAVTNLINRKLKPYRGRCAHLKLDQVNRIMLAQNDLGPEQTERHYLLQFQTKPGQAMFDVTVLVAEPDPKKHRSSSKTTSSGKTDPIQLQVVGEINRINKFRGQSDCVANENQMVERFCYCKS